MPRATVDIMKTERFELKSCPGGFVELRKLSYGQILERRGMMAGMRVRAGQKGEFEGEIQTINNKVTLFEIKNCLVDHNLEDDKGQPLDLSQQHVLFSLEPKIGQEIETLIDKLNNFEEDDGAEGNSPAASERPLTVVTSDPDSTSNSQSN